MQIIYRMIDATKLRFWMQTRRDVKPSLTATMALKLDKTNESNSILSLANLYNQKWTSLVWLELKLIWIRMSNQQTQSPWIEIVYNLRIDYV